MPAAVVLALVAVSVGACSDEGDQGSSSPESSTTGDSDTGDGDGDASGDGDGDTSGEPESCGPELDVPAQRWFRAPDISWAEVEGAGSYALRISTQGSDVVSVDDAGTSWSGELEVGAYEVEVRAEPGGETCTAAFAVRTLEATPDAVSPEPLCASADGVGSLIAYGLAVLDGSVYASFNADGAGVCRYDAQTLDYLDTVPGFGGNFRTFGVWAEPEQDAIYFSTYPFLGMCGDRLDRIIKVVDPDGAPSVETLDIGVEAANSIAIGPDGLIHSSGPWAGNCWQEDSFCLDFGAPCTNGDAAWASVELASNTGLSHGSVPNVNVGLAADADAVYRAGIMDTLEIFDPNTGPLSSIPLPSSPRGLIRIDEGGDRLLLVTSFDNHLRVYRLPEAGPPASAEDLQLELELALDDRYWQGWYDAATQALYFPAQESRTIRRHDLR